MNIMYSLRQCLVSPQIQKSSLPQYSLDTGNVWIKSFPPGAELYVNNEYCGLTPIRLTDVEPGLYPYTLKLQGYKDYTDQVLVESGKTSPDFAVLELNGNNSINSLNKGQTIGFQSLQPPPTPGYVTIPERSIIYILGGIIIGFVILKLLERKKD